MKAQLAPQAQHFEQLPNVGKATAADFRLLGFSHPFELIDQDPLALYERLCVRTSARQDPCVLDTFMAAIDFMNGAKAKPWWHFTARRKQLYPDI